MIDLSNLETIGTVLGAITAIVVAWRRWIGPWLGRLSEAVHAAAEAAKAGTELLRAQMAPNGGSSLIDLVRRIADQTEGTAHGMSVLRAEMWGRHKDLEGRTVRLEREVFGEAAAPAESQP